MENNALKLDVLKLYRANEFKKPEFGLRFQHLEPHEISWIYQGDYRLKYRIEAAKRFENKHLNLEEFSNNFSIEMLNNAKQEEYPNWYILKLVEFGRISLSIDLIMRLRLTRNEILLNKSYLYTKEFIEKFEDYAINKLMHSNQLIKKSVTIQMCRMLMYYQITIDNFIENTKKYMDDLEQKVSKNKFRKMINVVNVLIQMGFDIDYNVNSVIESKIVLDSYPQIKNGYEEYRKYAKTNFVLKTNETELSHIRCFINHLYKYFPEVDNLTKLKYYHFEHFVREQKKTKNIRGKKNDYATINHRLDTFNKMLKHLRSIEGSNIPNFNFEYLKLKEPRKFTKYHSKKDILRLVEAVKKADTVEGRFIQHKMALIISIDTGRRMHEIISLNYDCYKNGKVFFHKTKNKKPGWQPVGQATINAIHILKEYADNIKTKLYSKYDGQTSRRLFPSKYQKGSTILSHSAVSEYFKRIQLNNNIVDEKGNAKYRLHDNKRNFVTCMLAAKVKPDEISRFLRQDTNSLIPYEVNNGFAIKTLKKIEERGLLVGKDFNENKVVKDENPIINLLKDVNVVERNKQNLIYKINNPKEAMPLALGYCTDYNNYDICGDLICLACNEFRSDSLEDFYNYASKIYKYIYKYKRDKTISDIEKKLLNSLENFYNNMLIENKEDFKSIMRKVRKSAKEVLKNNG